MSNYQEPIQIQQRQQYHFNSPREVSETDLYLLGAIEKLVYRVDYMEKRLKRTEQLVYHLMAGNRQQIESDACPRNFTKINSDCYHFGLERLDWKSASQRCKAMGAILAEFEKVEKYQDVIASILSHQEQRGHDFWLGGINPGLLFIWTTSAKPVNPNANLTLFTAANKTSENVTKATTKVPAKVLNNAKKNETSTTNFPEIMGSGRCLRLSYNPSTFSYGYTGQDCSSKQHFMCLIQDKSLDNEIKRIAKDLNFNLN